MGLHPGHQLAGAEWLGHIVVRPKPKATDLVNVILLGRHHDNGRILFIPDLPADLESINPGKHKIQDEHVKLLAQRLLKARLAVIGNLHLESAQVQIIFFQICNRLFVLNYQYLTHEIGTS